MGPYGVMAMKTGLSHLAGLKLLADDDGYNGGEPPGN